MSRKPHKNWRVGHHGRDMMYYEEKIAGTWQRLDIDGEMLLGRAHHVIYFTSAEQWHRYPDWARQRRDEIIARIKMEFRKPDYEYHEEAAGAASSAAAPVPVPVPVAPRPGPAPARMTLSERTALLAVIAILLGITAGMGWLVGRGLQSGETWLPSKRASHRRVIFRQQEPVAFHSALGVYALLGLVSGGAAWWTLRTAGSVRR